jgi:hypothetical protein
MLYCGLGYSIPFVWQDFGNYTQILPFDNDLVTTKDFLRGTHPLVGLRARTNFKFYLYVTFWKFTVMGLCSR